MIDCGYLSIIAVSASARQLALAIGGVTFIGGLLAMFAHHRHYQEAFARRLKPGELIFEIRKCRRRILVAGLISSLGVMLACLNWISQPRQFSCLILIILLTLVAILGGAVIDMYSVGLQALTRKKKVNGKQLIEDYLQQKKAEHASQSSIAEDLED